MSPSAPAVARRPQLLAVRAAAPALVTLAAALALRIEVAMVIGPLPALLGAELAAHRAGHLATAGGALHPCPPHPGRGGARRRVQRRRHEQEAVELAVVAADRRAGHQRLERVALDRVDGESAGPLVALLVV